MNSMQTWLCVTTRHLHIHVKWTGSCGHRQHIQVLLPAQTCLLLLLRLMCAAGIYDPAFIAANQESRADNIIKGSKMQQVGSRTQPAMPQRAGKELSISTGLAAVALLRGTLMGSAQDLLQGRGVTVCDQSTVQWHALACDLQRLWMAGLWGAFGQQSQCAVSCGVCMQRCSCCVCAVDLCVQMETIRQHIRAFKADNGLDKVVVLWTANTERYAQVSQQHSTAQHSGQMHCMYASGLRQQGCTHTACAEANMPCLVLLILCCC